MSSHNRPLTCKEVKHILKNLGFNLRPQGSTSHEQWIKETPKFRKVTVDCPKAPFSHILITYMAKQAGINKKEFYAALDKKPKSIPYALKD